MTLWLMLLHHHTTKYALTVFGYKKFSDSKSKYYLNNFQWTFNLSSIFLFIDIVSLFLCNQIFSQDTSAYKYVTIKLTIIIINT